MDYKEFIDQVAEHADAMRTAVVAAGPDATVPNCPEWTVCDLVRHLARVHQWSGKAMVTAPDGERPSSEEPPRDWDALLRWWDEQIGILVGTLRGADQDTPAWGFIPGAPRTAGFWARRQAHETAIHRLDAEHAAAGSDRPDAVPALVFDPAFAADGIDEVLRFMVPAQLRRQPAEVSGTVLVHAADAGQTWLVDLRPGEPPRLSIAKPGIDADASVVGTADAVYRAVWRRPSTAILGGDHSLIAALRVP